MNQCSTLVERDLLPSPPAGYSARRRKDLEPKFSIPALGARGADPALRP
jgi:hypothetical protein